jgi:predicted ArsR family transcriptional regulator
MSSTTPNPYDLEQAAIRNAILDAMRESEFEDTSVREVADVLSERDYQTVRKHVRELREEGSVEVTRTVGPGKLYRVVEADEGDA